MKKMFLLWAIFLLPLGLGIHACGIPEELDEANKIVKDGIEKIRQESERWREIVDLEMIPALEALNGNLSDLIYTIESLKNSVAADVQSGIQCAIDSAPQKMIKGLTDIMTTFDGRRRESFAYPTVCTVSPAVIDLDYPAHLRRTLTIAGYDFVEDDELVLWLVDANGEDHIVREPRLTRNTDYRLIVNIADWDDTLKRYSTLKVTYADEKITTVPIIK